MRLAAGIEYQGSDFFGWQYQENRPTVQGCLENALSQIANKSIKVICAGRTDAGVHAAGQVIHFDTDTVRPLHAWTIGTNTYLPPTISVRWIQEVDEYFHARFIAIARRYRYMIYNQHSRSALLAARATRYSPHLNHELMQLAGSYLLGENDFSAFRSAQCESLSPMRHVQDFAVKREGDLIIIDIQANAFLHHMVRNIVGVLLEIGSQKKPVDWIQEVLHSKDRRKAAQTAPPQGLYLYKVIYPEKYTFPEPTLI